MADSHEMRATPRPVALLDLGTLPYDEAHALQLALVEARQTDQVADALLLLEHTPVITLGRRAEPGHILATEAELARLGVAVRPVERGGDVTYHGPGQLVGYPILRLADYGLGASDYMHLLEELLIRVCADLGLGAGRREEYIGVWIGHNKIAALGVRIRRGVTFHGFAFNVNPQMAHWDLIVPCGITDGGVTSLEMELGQAPPMDALRERVCHHFQALFGASLYPAEIVKLLRHTEGTEQG
jgi:lipoate-protein ligase B